MNNEIMPFHQFEFLGKCLTSARWIFAKTMPHNPHWYTLRKEWLDPDFEHCVNLIRAHGYKKLFGKTYYTEFNVNDCEYWTMGWPAGETTLINRKVLKVESDYDSIAEEYDSLFVDEESLAENTKVMGLIQHSDHVLDIGCGTGLYLDYNRPARYKGVDPARAMIAQLRAKYPAYADVTNFEVCPFESFYSGDRYHTIACLFGSANYIPLEALQRIPIMLADGGNYAIMLFKPDYSPVTHEKAGIHIKHYYHPISAFPGATVTSVGNYYLLTGGK